MSEEEYLAMERATPTKYELWNGEVFAMTGGTLEHGRLAGRLIYLLNRALAGRGCHVFTSDVRVHIEATSLADIIRRNTDIGAELPEDVFQAN